MPVAIARLDRGQRMDRDDRARVATVANAETAADPCAETVVATDVVPIAGRRQATIARRRVAGTVVRKVAAMAVLRVRQDGTGTPGRVVVKQAATGGQRHRPQPMRSAGVGTAIGVARIVQSVSMRRGLAIDPRARRSTRSVDSTGCSISRK